MKDYKNLRNCLIGVVAGATLLVGSLFYKKHIEEELKLDKETQRESVLEYITKQEDNSSERIYSDIGIMAGIGAIAYSVRRYDKKNGSYDDED